MPLPVSDLKTVWPPKNMSAQILPKMAEWSAWYSNDLAKLQAAYGGGPIVDQTGFFASDKGGFKPNVGRRLIRWFVGEPARGPERVTKLPIPLAPEISQASADLLFSDPPTFIVDDKATQARLDELCDDRMFSMFGGAAELCAALGGVFLKVGWDINTFADRPFLCAVDADMALPEFMYGKLSAVTFWQVVAVEDTKIWRHLERHEVAPDGNGVIIHGLYEGTQDALGTRVSLSSRPETMALYTLTEGSAVAGQIDSGTPGLCVVYVPNQTPNRQWRSDPIGRYLGRSDYDGVEHLFDQLAEIASGLARAIRVGKARILFDKALAQNPGPGQGLVVNADQEVFTTISMTVGPNTTLADRVQVLQPVIPVQPYLDAMDAIVLQVLQSAGYSQQTYGVGDTGTVRTATEIESRERRSLMTRARKIREWAPAMQEALLKLLSIDNEVFSGSNNADSIYIEFPDSVQETQLSLAQTVSALFVSESASLHERVNIMHPDWNDDQVKAEVAAIKAEVAVSAAVPDPLALPPESPARGAEAANDGVPPVKK